MGVTGSTFLSLFYFPAEENGCKGITCIGDENGVCIDRKPPETGFLCTCKEGFRNLNDANRCSSRMSLSSLVNAFDF
jgi:hypothetical protein